MFEFFLTPARCKKKKVWSIEKSRPVSLVWTVTEMLLRNYDVSVSLLLLVQTIRRRHSVLSIQDDHSLLSYNRGREGGVESRGFWERGGGVISCPLGTRVVLILLTISSFVKVFLWRNRVIYFLVSIFCTLFLTVLSPKHNQSCVTEIWTAHGVKENKV